mmetsp:Transcript_124012/g.243272  ORF Transcript_124012/g.243272 Transcript_124012/m.243272 type:complete len:133 (-) Transcript_124012:104-502(-)
MEASSDEWCMVEAPCQLAHLEPDVNRHLEICGSGLLLVVAAQLPYNDIFRCQRCIYDGRNKSLTSFILPLWRLLPALFARAERSGELMLAAAYMNRTHPRSSSLSGSRFSTTGVVAAMSRIQRHFQRMHIAY